MSTSPVEFEYLPVSGGVGVGLGDAEGTGDGDAAATGVGTGVLGGVFWFAPVLTPAQYAIAAMPTINTKSRIPIAMPTPTYTPGGVRLGFGSWISLGYTCCGFDSHYSQHPL